MTRFFVVLLMCAFARGQTAPSSAPAAHAAAQSTANLNDSENARQARAALDKAIEALGGPAYLTYENRVEEGRYYPLYHGRTDSTGIPYRYYVDYPEQDRFEVLHMKALHIIPGTIDIGDIKGKVADIVLIHNGDKGYEITYKGTAAQDRIE